MIVAIVDYGSGNLRSAAKAFERAAAEDEIPAEVKVTSDAELVAAADRIVLPGVGAFADCRRGLAAVTGLEAALYEAVIVRARPFLGICVGMQLMAERGLEYATTPGFHWIRGEIAPMEVDRLRLPHMGWNNLLFEPDAHPLLTGIAPGAHVYFVHSYALRHGDPEEQLATTDYGGPVPAMVARGNRAGTQFHVEKSQGVGLRILANFLRWMP